MEDLILSKRHRKSPSFEFLGGVTLMLSRLVVGCISIFLLSLFAYFLWRTLVRNLFYQLWRGSVEKLDFPRREVFGGVHPILV